MNFIKYLLRVGTFNFIQFLKINWRSFEEIRFCRMLLFQTRIFLIYIFINGKISFSIYYFEWYFTICTPFMHEVCAYCFTLSRIMTFELFISILKMTSCWSSPPDAITNWMFSPNEHFFKCNEFTPKSCTFWILWISLASI